MEWIDNLTLEGKYVRLVPLEMNHKADLLAAASDGNLWELWYTSVPSESTIDNYVKVALSNKNRGTEYPFVVIDQLSDDIVGCTRFYNLQPAHRRLENGYTWYAQRVHQTGINTECKMLMLRYAFEVLKCIAVQFMTNWHNIKSRTAIARLGARQDGVLRNHRIMPYGSYSDTVVFSITESEWGGVRKTLELKLR